MMRPIHAERIELRHVCTYVTGTRTETVDANAYSAVEMLANGRVPQATPARKLRPVVAINGFAYATNM